MARRRHIFAALLALGLWASAGAAAPPNPDSDDLPPPVNSRSHTHELVTGAAGVVLAAALIYFALPRHHFRVRVRGNKVTFHGEFPPILQGTIRDFLLHDVALSKSYTVYGDWTGQQLKITVSRHARPCEHLIRNFFKLHVLKRSR